LRYTANFAAGKNKIINGDFRIWQRGTSYSNPKGVFTADRFAYNYDGTGNLTLSQQTFTPGTAPVAGYEGQFFLRVNQTTAGSGTTFNVLQQPIEDVRTFAGQTVTVSFWAKADAARTTNVSLVQTFGTGGSGSVGSGYVDVAVTTSWVRYSVTINVPSISGKTIGANDSALRLFFDNPKNTTFTIDYWGIQAEAGSVATAFQTATGTLQGELAACQRYYYEMAYSGAEPYGSGAATSATAAVILTALPVSMRVAPTAVYTGTFRIEGGASKTGIAAASLSLNQAQNQQILTAVTSSSLTAGWGFVMLANGASAIKLSAEL